MIPIYFIFYRAVSLSLCVISGLFGTCLSLLHRFLTATLLVHRVLSPLISLQVYKGRAASSYKQFYTVTWLEQPATISIG
jgi:hypothetical protein